MRLADNKGILWDLGVVYFLAWGYVYFLAWGYCANLPFQIGLFR